MEIIRKYNQRLAEDPEKLEGIRIFDYEDEQYRIVFLYQNARQEIMAHCHRLDGVTMNIPLHELDADRELLDTVIRWV